LLQVLEGAGRVENFEHKLFFVFLGGTHGGGVWFSVFVVSGEDGFGNCVFGEA
jgi:hypothetical protein